MAPLFSTSASRAPPGDAHDHAAVAGEVDVDGLAGGQGDAALGRLDAALVPDHRGDQGDAAAGRGGDPPLVDDAAAVALELELAGQEVGVAEVQRGGHQTADIDLGALGEEHAGRVDQDDLSVGGEASEDLGRTFAGNPVQGGTGAARLHEVDAGVAADVEALPVGDHALGVLVDRHAGAGLADAALAGGDLAARGQGGRRGVGGPGRPEDETQGSEQGHARGALAARLDEFGNRHPALREFVPDESIGLVHGVASRELLRRECQCNQGDYFLGLFLLAPEGAAWANASGSIRLGRLPMEISWM